MLDLKLIRENPEMVKEAIYWKNEKGNVDKILELDKERRKIINSVEKLKKERNDSSKLVSLYKREGKDTATVIEKTKSISNDIKDLDQELAKIESDLQIEIDRIPNMPHETAPKGLSEQENVEIKTWGKIPEFDFDIKDHIELGENLDILDFKRGGKISGTGFAVYKGAGAQLERALLNYMLDLHIKKHGYTEILPPFLTNRESMYGTGQIPKLEEDMYFIEKDELFLVPTAEVPVINLHRNEVLDPEKFPIKYTAFSACFRREAGSHGKDTRGFLRVHQFNKVEMINFCLPEKSYEMHEQMLTEATEILENLNIPYRIMSLATGDLSFAAAKCFDIDTWSPAENKWLEASSVSNTEDFQARRANIKFRREKGKPLEFVHTLNGSGLATSRLMVSILENNQTDEGTVIIPEVLRPYMNDMDIIKRKY